MAPGTPAGGTRRRRAGGRRSSPPATPATAGAVAARRGDAGIRRWRNGCRREPRQGQAPEAVVQRQPTRRRNGDGRTGLSPVAGSSVRPAAGPGAASAPEARPLALARPAQIVRRHRTGEEVDSPSSTCAGTWTAERRWPHRRSAACRLFAARHARGGLPGGRPRRTFPSGRRRVMGRDGPSGHVSRERWSARRNRLPEVLVALSKGGRPRCCLRPGRSGSCFPSPPTPRWPRGVGQSGGNDGGLPSRRRKTSSMGDGPFRQRM